MFCSSSIIPGCLPVRLWALWPFSDWRAAGRRDRNRSRAAERCDVEFDIPSLTVGGQGAEQDRQPESEQLSLTNLKGPGEVNAAAGRVPGKGEYVDDLSC